MPEELTILNHNGQKEDKKANVTYTTELRCCPDSVAISKLELQPFLSGGGGGRQYRASATLYCWPAINCNRCVPILFLK